MIRIAQKIFQVCADGCWEGANISSGGVAEAVDLYWSRVSLPRDPRLVREGNCSLCVHG